MQLIDECLSYSHNLRRMTSELLSSDFLGAIFLVASSPFDGKMSEEVVDVFSNVFLIASLVD